MGPIAGCRWFLSMATVFVLVLMSQTSAEAQRPRERYQPARPTLSPYLDLFRQDTGVIDPFNNFVVPQRRMQATAREFQREVTSQQATINQLQQQVDGEIQIRAAGISPTGTGATFMNHLHFFPQGGGGRRR